MSNGHIGIFGTGGHARVAADCAIAAGLMVDAFYDDDEAVHGQMRFGSPGIIIRGGRDDAVSLGSGSGLLVAIGDNHVRSDISRWLAERGVEFETVVHPATVIGSYVDIGAGSILVAGVVINTGARIGDHVIVNTSASIDHDCKIGDYVHISPGVHLAGDVKVGEGAHIGIGASVTPGITIGAWSVVGAGAVVYKEIPEGVTVVGLRQKIRK